MTGHPDSASLFLKKESYVDWHDETLWWVREKRDKASGKVRDWEKLRENASKIKEHTLHNLAHYLQEFEKNATANGIKVHWAKDAEAHNSIVYHLIKQKDARCVVKSKSMLTEECGLNDYLENQGIEVVDTDLGERIIQWMEQTPSHIVLPAIHLKKKAIGEIFTEKLGIPFSEDADKLTQIARNHLRDYFLSTQIAITGVNFAMADSGAFVICTNEGNADMGVHLADVHIASMGIEKIIPETAHLGVFLRLLARSATGQPITSYSSHFRKPAKGKEIHVILVDNGRSEILHKEKFRSALKCIRCGACMNTCPVFRKTGGHSYQSTIPGPIGAILSPHYDPLKYGSLPFASTLCGSCSAICPVKIDIDDQLYYWRQELNEGKSTPLPVSMAAKFLAKSGWFDLGSKLFSIIQKLIPNVAERILKPYAQNRKLPDPPEKSFKAWYAQNS
jgi:L-lactate dehydrogenase complex protein LldF